MMIAAILVMLALAVWAYLAMARAEKAARQPAPTKVSPTRNPTLFVPLEGQEGAQEGLPRGTWVL